MLCRSWPIDFRGKRQWLAGGDLAPEVFYFDGTTYYLLNGLSHLNFTSPTGGTIKFRYTDYPVAVTIPAFTNYSEVAGDSPNLTVVNFSINFTNGTNSSNCTLPVTIKYEIN